MGHYFNPNIVTDGLILNIDASNARSYPGSGTAINDLSGQDAHGTINGTVSFVGAGVSSYWNFATASSANFISSTKSQAYVDCTIIFQPDFTLNAGLVGLVASSTSATNADKSMRFNDANGTGPWKVRASAGIDANDWGNTSTTYYVNGNAVADGASLNSGWNFIGAFRTNQSSFPASFSYFLGSGGYSPQNRNFQGRIAVCLMYNRQLTAREHAKNFAAFKGRFGLTASGGGGVIIPE